jgi:outer membrane protein OmpA-like peptidoglycan-associated protein
MRHLTLIIGVLAAASPAAADPWLVAEAPAAVAVSEPQGDVFRPGFMPALGVYIPANASVAFGARARGGVLGDGAGMPPGGQVDPKRGGLAAIGLGLRIGSAPWIEVVAGGGITGDDVVGTGELAVGWRFRAGSVDVGPSLRYLHVATAGERELGYGAAGVVLVGVELQIGAPRARRARPRPADTAAVAVAPDRDPIVDVDQPCSGDDATCREPDRDGDGFADSRDKCPGEAEVVNGVFDDDGCPDNGVFVVENDRIVLEERVLFDVNRARIKSTGRVVIEAIAAACKAHPEWAEIAVEGHADVRGTAEFNDWLSGTRADRVRDALLGAGIDDERVSAKGFGATAPRDPERTETAHARNRRVEFVISRTRSQGAQP